MAGSFRDAFKLTGIVPASAGVRPVVARACSAALTRPAQTFIEADQTIPNSHKQEMLACPVQMGHVIEIPYHFEKNSIVEGVNPVLGLVTGFFFNNDKISAVSFAQTHSRIDERRRKNLFFKKSDLNIIDCSEDKISFNPSGLNIIRLSDRTLDRISVIGSMSESHLKHISYDVRSAVYFSGVKIFGEENINKNSVFYSVSEIVPPIRPVLKPGDYVACYYPELPDTQPGPKLRPALITKIAYNSETGVPEGAELVPSTSVDKDYPGDYKITSDDFKEFNLNPMLSTGGVSRIKCAHDMVLPLSNDYFGAEFLIYGTLKDETLENIKSTIFGVDRFDAHVKALHHGVHLNPNWRLSRNPTVAPLLSPSCRIK